VRLRTFNVGPEEGLPANIYLERRGVLTTLHLALAASIYQSGSAVGLMKLPLAEAKRMSLDGYRIRNVWPWAYMKGAKR
jgi:hypothetical protein